MSNVIPLGNPEYDFTNAKRVGPGTWMMFMIMSGNSEDRVSRLWVCKQIRMFIDYFGCGDCKPHAVEKVTEDPPESHIGSNRELFEWVVGFMNDVQVRLKKPLYDVNILWRRFTEKDFQVCSSGCGGETKENTKAVQIVTPRRNNGFVLVRFGP